MKSVKVSDKNHKRLADYVTFERKMDDVIGMLLDIAEKKGVKK